MLKFGSGAPISPRPYTDVSLVFVLARAPTPCAALGVVVIGAFMKSAKAGGNSLSWSCAGFRVSDWWARSQSRSTVGTAVEKATISCMQARAACGGENLFRRHRKLG